MSRMVAHQSFCYLRHPLGYAAALFFSRLPENVCRFRKEEKERKKLLVAFPREPAAVLGMVIKATADEVFDTVGEGLLDLSPCHVILLARKLDVVSLHLVPICIQSSVLSLRHAWSPPFT